jgi:hypothetical protein
VSGLGESHTCHNTPSAVDFIFFFLSFVSFFFIFKIIISPARLFSQLLFTRASVYCPTQQTLGVAVVVVDWRIKKNEPRPVFVTMKCKLPCQLCGHKSRCLLLMS